MTTTFVCADAILDATTIRQITSSSHSGGNTARKSRISGGAAVSQVSGLMAEEVTTLASADMAALVALNTNTFCSAGLYIAAGTITLPYKSRTDGGQFVSSTNFSAIGGTKALIIPTGFEASQDEDAGASCTFEVHWISATGAAKAATGSTGNSLAAQAFNAEYALGPCLINGTAVPGVQSFRVNPGITLVKSRADGLVYPVKCSIQEITPTIEITTDNIEEVIALVGSFNALTSANCYMRKRADAGVHTASATTEHVRFTFAAGLYFNDSVDVSDLGNGTSKITLHGKTLTASAAVALP